MDKVEIISVVYGAIIEVSPFARDLLAKRSAKSISDLQFVDLGINSIDYAEIAQIVMARLNIALPIEVLARTNSINDVVDLVSDEVKTSASGLD